MKSLPREHEVTLKQIRAAAIGPVNPEALRQLIWESGVDIDRLVDRLARTHPADGYRSPSIQKRTIDACADDVLARLDGSKDRPSRADIQDLLDRWYSRYLLAADVGFELGFAAAQTLQGRREL